MRHDDPLGGLPPAPRNQLSLLRLVALALACLAGLAVAAQPVSALPVSPAGAAQENDEDEDEDDDEEQHVYALGETAHTSDFDVSVHGSQDPWVSANEFDTPFNPNYRFVAVEASIKNTSDDPRSFSSWDSELIDGLDRPWDPAFAGYELPELDAVTVAPGEVRRGWMVFEVPPDANEFQIRIKGSATANGSLFDLAPPPPA